MPDLLWQFQFISNTELAPRRIVINNHKLRKLTALAGTIAKSSSFLTSVYRKFGLGYKDGWEKAGGKSDFDSLYKDYAVDFNSMITGPKTRIGLVACSNNEVIDDFVKSCEEMDLEFQVFDPEDSDFIDLVRSSGIKKFLIRPSHNNKLIRQMFTEKIDCMHMDLDLEIYPSWREQRIYEAKRVLAYFLEANNIPCPKTRVFYKKSQALSYLDLIKFPIVFKTHNGSSSTGVEIAHSKKEANKLINIFFDSLYAAKGSTDIRDSDYGYVLLQEYIEGAREHRVIKIGESWFGHEKVAAAGEEFKSGSGFNLWNPPSERLLRFCCEIADMNRYRSMCFDIFEDQDGKYFVNELQTWFGSYNPAQMYIDEVPGRYIRNGDNFEFQAGLFNHNSSVALRIVDMLNS